MGTAATAEYVDSASVVTHYLSEDLGYRVVVAVVQMPDRLQVVGRSRHARRGHRRGAEASRRRRSPAGGVGRAAGADSIEEVLAQLREALDAEVRPPLRARDIATAPVRTVTPETTMREAGRLMQRWGHGGLPVVDDGRVVGLVTRKDVDKAVRHGLEHAPVKGFMAREVDHGRARRRPDRRSSGC